ncbi:coiled-coil domain-containing protein (plasmid) [Alkalihalophilus sp. As8PL]|uniref:Coiled-coil domain-containing protein n=1 Tax=Alkalihalophilus sp. As8PL TaxID=3237103 RepID=A0AB39BMR7_9BACI
MIIIKPKILLAIGNEKYSDLVKGRLEPDFDCIEQYVYHHKYIHESIDQFKPNIVIFHEKYLKSEASNENESFKLWSDTIEIIRKRDDDIRIIMLCERPQGHPFLKLLITLNVLDIFNERVIDLTKVKEQLQEKPRYKNVSNLKLDSSQDIMESTNEEIEDLQAQLDAAETVEEKARINKEIEQKTNELRSLVENLNKKYSFINLKELNKQEEAKEKKEKKEKEKKEKKVIEKHIVKQEIKFQAQQTITEIVGVMVKPKVILVGGVDRRVGTTFFSHLLAAAINKYDVEVGYIENPYSEAYTYDRYFGEENAPKYVSSYSKRNINVSKRNEVFFDEELEFVWKTDSINWIVRNPTKEEKYVEEQLTSLDFAKTLLYLHTPIKIIDIGSDWDREAFKDLYDLADHIYVVSDMDLVTFDRFFSNNERLDLLESFNERVNVVFNKTTKKLEQSNAFATDFPFYYTYIPEVNSDDVYSSQQKGELVTNNRMVNKMMKPRLQSIIENILPKELIKKKSTKRSLLPKLKIEKA